jgi:hypothetical protein
VAGSCEHGNKPSGSIKDKEFFFVILATVSLSKRTLPRGVNYFLTYLVC